MVPDETLLEVIAAASTWADRDGEAGAPWLACLAVRDAADSVPEIYFGWMPDDLQDSPLVDCVTYAAGTAVRLGQRSAVKDA